MEQLLNEWLPTVIITDIAYGVALLLCEFGAGTGYFGAVLAEW